MRGGDSALGTSLDGPAFGKPLPPGLLPWKASSENTSGASQVHLSCLRSPEKATGSRVCSQVYLEKREGPTEARMVNTVTFPG